MPRTRKQEIHCQVCDEQPSKYTCPQCSLVYCSVVCYKSHKEEELCGPKASAASKLEVDAPRPGEPEGTPIEDAHLEPTPLRPLTSLKWPYVPEESTYPDPLKRDDPKTLQLSQYEAIATSPKVRRILEQHKNLPDLLTSLDKLRGQEREEALQGVLGVTAPHIDDQLRPSELSEDTLALRELAEAIESAVRGGNQSALGLDWGD